MKDLLQSIRNTYAKYVEVVDECVVENMKRTYYLAAIAVPLRLIDITLILISESLNDVAQKWKRGIIASHMVLLAFMVVLFILAASLKNNTKPNWKMVCLQYLAISIIMMVGIVISTFDQIITTNITPFILSSIIVGLIYLIRPIISFVIFSVSYVVYCFAIGLYINDPLILLSNRVNGITAVGIGFFISIILWHYNYVNITQKRRIEQMAYYDSLTGLPNRRLFDNIVEHELAMIQKERRDTVLVLLDIDNFKLVNDTYGHMAGDYILKQVARLLRMNVRKTDIVARFGGEEFIILMPSTTIEEGYSFTERLRKRIEEEKFVVESNEIHLTASFGICKLTEDDSVIQYFCSADKALYLAKQLGKNRVQQIDKFC